MAYRCLFMDNGVYTAQDVNDAISNIISSGVSGYPFGSDALSDLNAAAAELVADGVQFLGNNCLVVNDNGTYKIQEGTCFMQDGSQIIFDSDGYEIDHNEGTHEYVYLERDVLHNTINVVVSDTNGGNDTVLLAEIDQSGRVLDRRRFAKSKVSLMAEPQNISEERTLQFEIAGHGTYSYDFGFDGWKYIIIRAGVYTDVLELNDGDTTDMFPHNNEVRTNRNPSYYFYNDVDVTRRGSILEFQNTYGSSQRYDVRIEVR